MEEAEEEIVRRGGLGDYADGETRCEGSDCVQD